VNKHIYVLIGESFFSLGNFSVREGKITGRVLSFVAIPA